MFAAGNPSTAASVGSARSQTFKASKPISAAAIGSNSVHQSSSAVACASLADAVDGQFDSNPIEGTVAAFTGTTASKAEPIATSFATKQISRSIRL